MTEAELQYEGCKGTVVYKTMMKRADTWRFEVMDDSGSCYKLKRVHDGQIADKQKSEVHSSLVLAND